MGLKFIVASVNAQPPIPAPPLPPLFSNFSIEPTEIQLGEYLSISFVIENTNNRSITWLSTTRIGDFFTQIIEIELEPYESKIVWFKDCMVHDNSTHCARRAIQCLDRWTDRILQGHSTRPSANHQRNRSCNHCNRRTRRIELEDRLFKHNPSRPDKRVLPSANRLQCRCRGIKLNDRWHGDDT